MITAQKNGRKIGAPDKLFGISAMAKEKIREIGRENVIDSTIGTLMDDNGDLVVLESVMNEIQKLQPSDYAAYAPISGLPTYLEGVKKAVFLDAIPDDIFLECCYTPGGTGAIRNAISAYSSPSDQVLTSDWHWAPYDLIASELGRKLSTYKLFNESMKFNIAGFNYALHDILSRQDGILVIINTPAHNPTGYTLSTSDWDEVINSLAKYDDKKIFLLADIAYLDFAGDPVKCRSFFSKLMDTPDNVLPLVAFSASKGYTMYGMRCGAIMCMSKFKETAVNFKDVMAVESRATWSNGNRMAMTVMAEILTDSNKFTALQAEREKWRGVLSARGKMFMEEADKLGLKCMPYDSGFFITIPCDEPDALCERLQADNLFAVPLPAGLRISIASNSVDECRRMPQIIKNAIDHK